MTKSPDVLHGLTLGVLIHIIDFKGVFIEFVYFFRCCENCQFSAIIFKSPIETNYGRLPDAAWYSTPFKSTSSIGIESEDIIRFTGKHVIF